MLLILARTLSVSKNFLCSISQKFYLQNGIYESSIFLSLHLIPAEMSLNVPPYPHHPEYHHFTRTAIHSWDVVGGCGASRGRGASTLTCCTCDKGTFQFRDHQHEILLSLPQLWQQLKLR